MYQYVPSRREHLADRDGANCDVATLCSFGARAFEHVPASSGYGVSYEAVKDSIWKLRPERPTMEVAGPEIGLSGIEM